MNNNNNNSNPNTPMQSQAPQASPGGAGGGVNLQQNSPHHAPHSITNLQHQQYYQQQSPLGPPPPPSMPSTTPTMPMSPRHENLTPTPTTPGTPTRPPSTHTPSTILQYQYSQQQKVATNTNVNVNASISPHHYQQQQFYQQQHYSTNNQHSFVTQQTNSNNMSTTTPSTTTPLVSPQHQNIATSVTHWPNNNPTVNNTVIATATTAANAMTTPMTSPHNNHHHLHHNQYQQQILSQSHHPIHNQHGIIVTSNPIITTTDRSSANVITPSSSSNMQQQQYHSQPFATTIPNTGTISINNNNIHQQQQHSHPSSYSQSSTNPNTNINLQQQQQMSSTSIPTIQSHIISPQHHHHNNQQQQQQPSMVMTQQQHMIMMQHQQQQHHLINSNSTSVVTATPLNHHHHQQPQIIMNNKQQQQSPQSQPHSQIIYQQQQQNLNDPNSSTLSPFKQHQQQQNVNNFQSLPTNTINQIIGHQQQQIYNNGNMMMMSQNKHPQQQQQIQMQIMHQQQQQQQIPLNNNNNQQQHIPTPTQIHQNGIMVSQIPYSNNNINYQSSENSQTTTLMMNQINAQQQQQQQSPLKQQQQHPPSQIKNIIQPLQPSLTSLPHNQLNGGNNIIPVSNTGVVVAAAAAVAAAAHPSNVRNVQNQIPTNLTPMNGPNTNSSNILINQINYLINLPLTKEEEDVLKDYDCRLFGFLKLESNDQVIKKIFILKAINCYEKRIKACLNEQQKTASPDKNSTIENDTNTDEKKLEPSPSSLPFLNQTNLNLNEKTSNNKLNPLSKYNTNNIDNNNIKSKAFRLKQKQQRLNIAELYLSLGHFYLLIYDYSKALSSYQKFLTFRINKLKKNYTEAVEKYEELFRPDANIDTGSLSNTAASNPTTIDASLKAKIYRQLGWLYFYSDQLNKSLLQKNNPINDSNNSTDTTTTNVLAPIRAELKELLKNLNATLLPGSQLKLQSNDPTTSLLSDLKINTKSLHISIDYLSKSAQLDPSQNLTWYYLGRALACRGNSREAFISYKNSVNNPEASSDTWCSIGVLYHQQKQYMDALQAFICAIQLNHKHFSAWLNLGVLYEQDNQLDEALKCYKTAMRFRIRKNKPSEKITREKNFLSDLENENKIEGSNTKLFSVESNDEEENDDLDTSFDFEEDLHSSPLVDTSEEKFIYLNEFKALSNRVKLLTTYFEMADEKLKEQLRHQTPHSLPPLKDAFSLQIPVELRQKIAFNSQLIPNKLNSICLGLNLNGVNYQFNSAGSTNNGNGSSNSTNGYLTIKQAQHKLSLKYQQQQQLMIQQQQHLQRQRQLQLQQLQQRNQNNVGQNGNKPDMKKKDLVMLKPQQIQLLNQLEQNRAQLNPDQMQMLNYLKSQYVIMQSQQNQNLQQNQQQQQDLDQLLPLDLENVQPITMMQHDAEQSMQSMLQDADLNTLLSRHDIVEDLKITLNEQNAANNQENVTPRDSTVSSSSSENNNPLTNSNASSAFALNLIKLDPSLTSQLSQNDGDDDSSLLLASKLNTNMGGEQILNACKSFGLNGLQSNCILKPSEISLPSSSLTKKRKLKKFKFKSEQDLIGCPDHKKTHSNKEKTTNTSNIDKNNTKTTFSDNSKTKNKPEDINNNNQNENEIKFNSSSSSSCDENDENDSDFESDNDIDDTYYTDNLVPYGLIGQHSTSRHFMKGDINLSPPGPSVILETKKDAYSPHLEYFCLSHPISVVRGLGHVLRLDLGLFSTKTLVETDPEHVVEVRNQRQQPSDENWDAQGKRRVWKCESKPSYTTLLKYAQYQAQSFQEAVKEEKIALTTVNATSSTGSNSNHQFTSSQTSVSKLLSCSVSSNQNNYSPQEKQQSNLITPPASGANNKNTPNQSNSNKKSSLSSHSFKTIKFGTNVDLSDEKKWREQLQELAKLPPFMRVISSGNMLTHVGYKIYGCNTPQIYLKVPGCRTPGHQENNSFCSLNINIGPGDCEWFGVDVRYWTRIEALCTRNDVNYLTGAWWPNLSELHEAKIPVYRFLQKPGDLVWVNSGCVHWVQSIGWCNNVSWNIGPMVYAQYKAAIERYEWNKFAFYKSIIPMVHLSWNLARNVKITDRRLYEYIKYVLMQSLKQCQLAINYIENCGCELKLQTRQVDEPAHYCYDCDCEVFNILFVSEQPDLNQQHSSSSSSSNQKKQLANNSVPQMQHVVHCQACARKRSHLLDNFVMLNQYSMDELKNVYDQFQLCLPNVQPLLNEINSTNTNLNGCEVNTNANFSGIITNSMSMDYDNNMAVGQSSIQQQHQMMMMIN